MVWLHEVRCPNGTVVAIAPWQAPLVQLEHEATGVPRPTLTELSGAGACLPLLSPRPQVYLYLMAWQRRADYAIHPPPNPFLDVNAYSVNRVAADGQNWESWAAQFQAHNTLALVVAPAGLCHSTPAFLIIWPSHQEPSPSHLARNPPHQVRSFISPRSAILSRRLSCPSILYRFLPDRPLIHLYLRPVALCSFLSISKLVRASIKVNNQERKESCPSYPSLINNSTPLSFPERPFVFRHTHAFSSCLINHHYLPIHHSYHRLLCLGQDSCFN